MREQYKRYLMTYDRQTLYDKLKRTYPAAFTDLVLTRRNNRIRYTATLIDDNEGMDTNEILTRVESEFGPLNKKSPEQKKLKGGAKTVYERTENHPLMKKKELKLIALINDHPDWDSDKLQAELKKD